MEKTTLRVIKGYSKLSDQERKEFREFIAKWEYESTKQKEVLIESLSAKLGPLSDKICPCCGR